MRPFRWLLIGLTFLGILQSSLLGQSTVAPRDPLATLPTTPRGQSLKRLDGQKIMFVVDGAGESSVTIDNVLEVTETLKVKMHIQPVIWCKSACSAAQHYQDLASHSKAAAWLAGQTTRIRNECPNAEIYYIGYSTGVRIVLLAAEMAPEQSVNRILLMAGVSSNIQDLRPALRASRHGIDNFWSSEDKLLEVISEKYGLPDGTKGRPAGLTGFRIPAWKDAEGFDAYKNLRQYRWTEDLIRNGGHLTWVSKPALKRYIIPMIAPEAATVGPRLR